MSHSIHRRNVVDTELGNNTTSFAVGSFFLGVLIGMVAGGITALLTVPKSGPETRGMIRDRFSQMKEIVSSRAKEAGEKAQQQMRS